MKKIFKKLTVAALALSLTAGIAPMQASAAESTLGGNATAVTTEASASVTWPSIGSTSYIEMIAQKTINAYTTSALKTRGTSSPSKAYDAYAAKGDVIKILAVTASYVKFQYPTSSGTRTAFASTSDVFGVTAPKAKTTAKGTATTYKYAGSTSYGSTAKGDVIYRLRNSGDYTLIVYTAVSGNRAWKAGWVSTSFLDGSAVTTGLTSPVPSGAKFSQKTDDNGWYGYHDINRGVTTGTKIYAIADGTITCKQAYRVYDGTEYLTSYGNYITFTSADGTYTAKYCHLNGFEGVSLKIPSSRTKNVSGSTGTYTRATKTVKKGDVIGYIGKTGHASGVHLHFELAKKGTRIDPTSVFPGLI